MIEPLPIGAVVEYHGSHSHDKTLLYVITGHEKPHPDVYDPEFYYPDGVAYTLWERGVLRKFGNRHHAVYQVRRSSLIFTGDVEDVANPYVEGETDEDELPLRLRAARELAAEFGTDVEEWLV